MTQISKRKLDSETYKYTIESLTHILKQINSYPEMDEFLNSALSDTERLMISKRITVAFLLKHGVEEATISKIIKVTPATISRLKLWIKIRQKGFDIVFEKLEKERKVSMAKDLLYKLLNYALNAAAGRSPELFKKTY